MGDVAFLHVHVNLAVAVILALALDLLVSYLGPMESTEGKRHVHVRLRDNVFSTLVPHQLESQPMHFSHVIRVTAIIDDVSSPLFPDYPSRYGTPERKQRWPRSTKIR